MSLQQSYSDVLDTATKAGVTLTDVKEEGGKLVLSGSAQYGYQRDLMWDQIKTHSAWQSEIMVLLNVNDSSIYGLYTVKAGDTLGKLAAHFLGAAKEHHRIFELNRDQLHDPDHIRVGQVLKIPNR